MERALILIDHGFQDAEVIYPLFRLREAGFEVVLAAREKNVEHKGMYGYPLKSDVAFSAVNAAKYEVLVVPGGEAAVTLSNLPAAVKLVHEADVEDLTIAAIGRGPLVCAAAGIVRNRNATSSEDSKAEMLAAGAIWEDSPVASDGNLVTSRKPEDLPDFMKRVVRIARKGLLNV